MNRKFIVFPSEIYPYEIAIRGIQFTYGTAIEWLIENYGGSAKFYMDSGWITGHVDDDDVWFLAGTSFFFRIEEHAIMFKLKFL